MNKLKNYKNKLMVINKMIIMMKLKILNKNIKKKFNYQRIK